jgi:hypothetical protein
MKQVLYFLYISLLFISCGSLQSEPDSMYEAAIRHYIESWSTVPDTVVLTVEGESPSEDLLSRLDDLDIQLTGKKDTEVASFEPGSYRDLSISNVRWRGSNRVILEVSYSTTTPDGHTDAHGVEYLLEKKEGTWSVIDEGVEWMT